MVLLPRLLMPGSLCLPPDECSLGVKPILAAKARPFLYSAASPARFQSDKAWRKIGKEWQHVFPFQFFVEYILAVFVHAMYLKILFCNIKPDLAYLSHDPLPCWLKWKNVTFWHIDAAESIGSLGAGLSHQDDEASGEIESHHPGWLACAFGVQGSFQHYSTTQQWVFLPLTFRV